MGKDRNGLRGAKYNPSNSGEAGTLMGSQASGFIGFSAFTSNFSNATDPDYYQVEPEYKVLLKKLQKKDSISRIKGLEELMVLFNKINVESSEFNASSISSLMNAWEFMYKRLVNDDDRQVRDLSNQCLGSIGSRIGKYLGPHVKSLLGPWLFAICDQQDQSTSNSALLAFNNIFPEKKRKDVFKFGHDEALTYLCENLQETAQTIGDSKSVHQDILQERYERCISNSLLAIEYLINSTSVTAITSTDTTSTSTTSDNTEIYEKIFESQFFSFFQSKSSNIRKTAYRVLATIIKKVPGYVDKNFKDFSSKVLGLFSEKDSSTHLYMWDAIISFLKHYKEKAWLNVDVRKHVLPRLWSFLRSGCYGSYELSYPSILPLLTFIPQSVIGDGSAFFKEFFTNLEKGLQAIDSSTVRNNTSNSSADNKPSMLLLSCYLECLIYSIKKWGTTNTEINSYLIDTLLSSLYQNYFKFEISPFNDNRLFIDKLLETTNKISTISPNVDSIFKSLSSDIFTTLITPTPTPTIPEVEHDTTTTATTTTTSSTTPITKKEEKVILPITNETLFSRLNSFLTVLKGNKIQESNVTGSQEFIKKLFGCSSENLKNNQEISIKVMDIVLANFKIDSILSNDSNEIKSFLNDTVISTFNNIGDDSSNNSGSVNGLVKSLISISITLLSSDSLSPDEIKQCWSNILTVFVNQRNSEQQLISLINGCKLDRSLYLVNPMFDKVIDQVCQSDEIPSIEKVSLISSLLFKYNTDVGSNGEYSPIISNQSIQKLINWVLVKLTELMDTIQMNLLMEFNIDYLVELSKLIFKISSVTIIGKSDKLYEQWTKFVIEINRSNLSTMYGKVVSDIESVLFNSSFTLSPIISNSILSILIDNVNNSSNNNINLTYLSNCAIKLIKNNFDNTYSTLLNQFSKNTLVSTSINQIQISWFRYNRITPFYLTSDTTGSESNSKSTNQLFKILIFNFKILESFGWNQFIKHSSSDSIKTMLINLLFLNGDNKYPTTTSNQNEIGQFIENNSEILICKFVESLYTSGGSSSTEIFNSQWFTEIIDSSKSNGIYLIALKLFVDYITESQDISNDIQQQLKNSIIEKVLPKVCDGDEPVVSKHQLNLIQVLLPILSNETIMKLKSNVVEKLVALTSSIPNSFSNVSIQLSLFTSILQLQRDGITKSDYSNLLHVLSMIQQWLSKLKSPLFKDDKSTLDSFTNELECSQLNLIILIVNYSTSKQEYLSNNQSSLVQSLLSVWLLPSIASTSSVPTTSSSNNNQLQYRKLVNYQSLKIFNQIISNDSLKYIVPGGDQFLIDHSILVLNKWLDQIGNVDLGFSSDSSIIFELFSNTFDKMSTDIKYKISLTRLDALISLLYCENTNIQKTTYNLLESYFINENTQLIKSFILNNNDQTTNINNNNNNNENQEDQIEYIVFSGEFEKILLDFENTWKPMKKNKESKVVNSKCLGQLLLWNLVMKNYSTLDLSRRSILNGWLNKDSKVSQLLNQIFTYAKKDESPNSNYNQFPWNNEIDMISYRSLQSLCSHCMYSLVNYLPNMVRRWADDCSTNSKVNQQIQNYIVRYVSPLIIQNEINRVNSYSRENKDECFSIKGSTSSKEVTAGYEKDEMTISLVLSIPDTYPLRVPTVEFSKRIGVSESQWRQWLLSMTSLVLTQDGSVLDACLLWKNALDKHFDGVEVCLICYSIFQGGTIPKFQCRTCKNKFHAGCIYKWFVTSCKNNCPLCQTEIAH